jgi:hypothetical protein
VRRGLAPEGAERCLLRGALVGCLGVLVGGAAAAWAGDNPEQRGVGGVEGAGEGRQQVLDAAGVGLDDRVAAVAVHGDAGQAIALAEKPAIGADALRAQRGA